MKTRRQPEQPSRYSYNEVVAEVARVLETMPRGTQKVLAIACNLDSPGFTNRMAKAGSRFTLEQIGALADALQAPPGWPFLSWSSDATTSAVPSAAPVRVPLVERRIAGELRRLARFMDDFADELAEERGASGRVAREPSKSRER
jgi:hypothetical protein